MSLYEVIETDIGLTVAELEPDMPPEEVAVKHHGILIDPGPFKTYDDAFDAILTLQDEGDEDDDGLHQARCE